MTVEIILNENSYGKELPKGNSGDRIKGCSYYELIKGKEDYICSRMGDVLEAVTVEQYKRWKNKNIIAKPAEFIWNKDLWSVQESS